MPFIDGKGRPEILVHPDIKLGLANYRPVDDPAPAPALSEEEQARLAKRTAAKKVIMDRKRREAAEAEQQKTGGTPDKG
ncbi:hypothetical protein GQ649_32865 [Rhodococcus sp. DSM 6344]|nr:hypothetical protein [Rhodococcus erythropolis]